MSIKPTTRLGYRESARPHSFRQRIPYEPEHGGEEKFRASREPRRYAGSKLGIDLRR